MHPRESIFTGVKIIDYRNGRYQGLFNSQTEKRQGMGILIDDDMNIYCSEWEDNKMNGLTFIYFANGNYIYGMWKSNEPHGVNIYRNKQFILIGIYHRGNNIGNTLAITDAINHMLVFPGEQITLREQRRKDIALQLISSENILEINFFEDIIYHTAGKNSIQLSKKQVSLINFLSNFAEKYRQYIKFDNKNNSYFFGFQNGVGFRFSMFGKVNHRMNILSIGSHEGEKISDFGKKCHQSRCIQQGNFNLKQTITYNKSSQRPREKCIAIFQKNHKKALNFVNQYFQYKGNLIVSIELFLLNHLYPKHQQNLKRDFQFRRTQKPQLYPIKQDDIQNRLSLLRKMSAKNDKKKNQVQNKYLKKYAQNRSTSALYRKQSTKNLNNNNYHKKYPRHNESIEIEQYEQIHNELNHVFKKEIVCQRCKSKQIKRSREKIQKQKQSPQKNKSRSKSGNKITNNRQFKYLVNYKPDKLKEKILTEKQKVQSRSFTNRLKKGTQENERQRLRIQNQIKIRQQLFNQQIQREVRDFNVVKQYPLTFSELLGPSNQFPNHLSSIMSFSPSSRQIQLVKDISSIKRSPNPDMDSNKNIELLQNRRNKILREFKQLNTQVTTSKNEKQPIHQNLKRNQQIKISPFNELPRYKQGLDQRDKILQFNRKYRNYLQNESNNLQNELYYNRYIQDQITRSPYAPSFMYTPPRNDFHLNQQYIKKSKQKKYQYFFNSPPH